MTDEEVFINVRSKEYYDLLALEDASVSLLAKMDKCYVQVSPDGAKQSIFEGALGDELVAFRKALEACK